MKTTLVRLFIVLIVGNILYAQDSEDTCLQRMKTIQQYANTQTYSLEDFTEHYHQIFECAENGNAEAQFMMAMMYADQHAITYSREKSEAYLIKAAQQRHKQALFALGLMYQHADEEDIEYTKAKTWYMQAYASGSQEAGYAIGYLYLKGLGTVPQDYTKAVAWFEKSNYPMAKHWLGICYYFGYGVAQSKEKGLSILANNPIPNSANLYAVLQGQGKKSMNTTHNKEELSVIKQVMIPTTYTNTTTMAQPHEIIGQWIGSILIYDFAGKQVEQSTPVYLQISEAPTSTKLAYTMIIDGQEYTGVANWSELGLQFATLDYSLGKVYTDNPAISKLTYQLRNLRLSASKQQSTDTYYTGTLDTRIVEYGEPGAPTAIILKKQAITTTSNNSSWHIYPNPTEDLVHINYALIQLQPVQITVYNAVGKRIKTIERSITPDTATTISLKDEPTGLYFITLTSESQTHTQSIIKTNRKKQ